MRRESSTVVALVGEAGEGLLAGLGRFPNISVARAPAAGAGQPAAEGPTAAGAGGAAGFEARAADALAAWRDKRFELPDYYLVVAAAQPGGTGPDLYLGPLRVARGQVSRRKHGCGSGRGSAGSRYG